MTYQPGGSIVTSTIVNTYNPATHKTVPKDAVVLDPSDPAVFEFVNYWKPDGGASFAGRLALLIEQQTRPAIEEPKGLGAVVEDDKGERWMRVCEHTMPCNSWAPVKGPAGDASGVDTSAHARREWPTLTPVRVLSEGVPS